MEKIINKLKQSNCIKEGSFILRNGETSKYYFDMKNLVSHPELLSHIGDMIYFKFIKDKVISINNTSNKKIRICGVPLGGLPISTYISTKYNIPMIMLRDKVKNYGTQKQIEGEYDSNDYCIIIEDVITTGSSVKEILSILENKINIISICSILNRSNLKQINNYNLDFLLNKNNFL
jgi:uridine monophosphate synthetase